ncbi:hypothetical protein M8C21_001743, partial [Ambrosia artemisiifolia]
RSILDFNNPSSSILRPLVSTTQLPHSPTFLDARSQQDLLSGIQKEMETGTIPKPVARLMEELYLNYRNAAIREPFNYYMFDQNYIRPLINFRESYVGNISLFHEIEEQLKKGENVILISNHQTEADPVIISLLLETTSPHISETAVYVAGDRVITDPLCKPFSMGRNLLCVYSKKHMNDVPELSEMKMRANTRTLKKMALLLRGGSKLIWIAASGGRDRPDPITNQWSPAPFDASAVDNMRRLVNLAGVRGHIYPLAVLSYDIMPPPRQVEKEIGERRVISFHGAGLSVAPKIDFNEITASCGDPDKAKDAYSQAFYDSVCRQYNVLKTAIHGAQGSDASTPSVYIYSKPKSTETRESNSGFHQQLRYVCMVVYSFCYKLLMLHFSPISFIDYK